MQRLPKQDFKIQSTDEEIKVKPCVSPIKDAQGSFIFYRACRDQPHKSLDSARWADFL